MDAVYQHILPMPCVRFLLADDPGLGKTIMAGLVLKELKARGMVRRVLLVVPAHLQDQWQREMNDWFREDFVPLRRDVLNSIYTADFFERNPQVLISMDLARREQVRDLLARQSWDLVVVDEAHKFSATRYGRKIEKTKRYQLGEALAKRTKHMLFLTATPHKGDDDAYFLLLSLLEPRLFANPAQLKRGTSRRAALRAAPLQRAGHRPTGQTAVPPTRGQDRQYRAYRRRKTALRRRDRLCTPLVSSRLGQNRPTQP